MNQTKRRGVYVTLLFVVCTWLIFAQCGLTYRIPDKRAIKTFESVGIALRFETIDVGNFNIHYAQTGGDSLPTLFFVHGSPGSWYKFADYLKDPDLVKKFRMISIDRPGFGYSEYGNTKNLAEQAKLVSQLLSRINNGKPIYAIGRSYGGPLIVKLAADNPGLFSGLFLLAAAVDPSAERPEKWRRWLLAPVVNYFVPGAWKQSNEELWLLKKDLVELGKDFSLITCPVYIFHSKGDRLVPVENVAYAKRMLINAQIVQDTIVPGKAHNISETEFRLIKKKLISIQ
jgi:pimeloyl-ACP methyl ester carboxylesterase